MSQRATTLTKALISFHSIYFIALGIYSLFFAETMLGKISNNLNDELIAINKYFGIMLILSGLFCHELF